jgi:hypothetical protein
MASHVTAAETSNSSLLHNFNNCMTNGEFRNLYSSPNIIKMIKSRRMRWAGNVGSMERRQMNIECWRESQKERDNPKHIDVDGNITLRRIFGK